MGLLAATVSFRSSARLFLPFHVESVASPRDSGRTHSTRSEMVSELRFSSFPSPTGDLENCMHLCVWKGDKEVFFFVVVVVAN